MAAVLIRHPWTVRALSLDLTGTVLSHGVSVAATYRATFNAHSTGGPLALTDEEVMLRFSAAFKAQTVSHPAFGHGDIGQKEWWSRVARDTLGTNAPESAISELYQSWSRPRAWKLRPDARRLLQRAHRAGMPIIFASNGDDRVVAALRLSGVWRIATGVVLAAQLGHEKPSRRFFDEVVRRARVERGAVLHVGDSHTKDLAGARAAGLNAALVRPGVVGDLDAVTKALFPG